MKKTTKFIHQVKINKTLQKLNKTFSLLCLERFNKCCRIELYGISKPLINDNSVLSLNLMLEKLQIQIYSSMY